MAETTLPKELLKDRSNNKAVASQSMQSLLRVDYGLHSITDLSFRDMKTIFEDASTFDRILNSGARSPKQKREKAEMATLLSGKCVFVWFMEASTRTRLNFQVGANALGATVIWIGPNELLSMTTKGESFGDTVRTYITKGADCIVIRDKFMGASRATYNVAAKKRAESGRKPIPVINAGDGERAHPTQTLIDLYKVDRKLGRLKGLTWVLSGDLGHARVVNGMIPALNYPELLPKRVLLCRTAITKNG